MSNTTTIVIIICEIIIGFYLFKYGRRHTKVLIFHHCLNQMALQWSLRHQDEIRRGTEQCAYDWFITKAPNYHRMVFSKKPITLDAWFDKEIIEKIKS